LASCDSGSDWTVSPISTSMYCVMLTAVPVQRMERAALFHRQRRCGPWHNKCSNDRLILLEIAKPETAAPGTGDTLISSVRSHLPRSSSSRVTRQGLDRVLQKPLRGRPAPVHGRMLARTSAKPKAVEARTFDQRARLKSGAISLILDHEGSFGSSF
jgi:hypothetical protein